MDNTDTTCDAVHSDSKMNTVCKPNVQGCHENRPSVDDNLNVPLDTTIIVTSDVAGNTSNVQDIGIPRSITDFRHDKRSKHLGHPEETSSANSEDKMSPSPSSVMTVQDQGDSIPVPPPVPKLGVSVLAHKLFIGNLDKRLTE